MNLSDCLPHLIYQFKSERELLEAVEELSQKFTVKRSEIGDYLKESRLTAAYTAFYLTTNIPKWSAVLKWLPDEFKKAIVESPFVDVGAGPGTFSLAFLEEEKNYHQKVYQLETSAKMREQALKLWGGLQPEIELEQLTHPKEIPGSFMVFGHSANEMGAEDALKYIEKINPEHILFIEPGTKSFFPQMLKIRESLIAQGFHVNFPCPWENACPMKESSEDWCHQFIHVRQSADVERLSQILKLDRKLLPLTVHAYSKSVNLKQQERIVRVHPSTKFSFEWDVCRGEKLEHYQVMKRGFDKKTQKRLDEVLSGDSVVTELDKELEEAQRVRLIKRNNQIL